MTVLTRVKIYGDVWLKPLNALGEEYGISGTYLKRLCKDRCIPTPPVGYWAMTDTRRGQIRRAPLKPDRTGVESVSFGNFISPLLKAGRALTKQIKSQSLNEGTIAVPSTLRNPHRIIAELMTSADARLAHEGPINAPLRDARRPDKLSETDRRRFRILDVLFKALEVRGFRIVLGKARWFSAQHDSGQVRFRLNEALKQTKHVHTQPKMPAHPTIEERARVLLWRRVTIELETTGKLVFDVEGRVWTEDQRSPIEASLGEIIAAIVVTRGQHQAAKLEEHKTQTVAKARRRDEEADAQRLQLLRRLADDWHAAQKLRAFIEAAGRSDIDGVTVEGQPLSELIQWAREKIDEMDPLSLGRLKDGLQPR